MVRSIAGALALERRLLELHRLLRDGSRRVRGSFGEPPSERSAAPEPSVASEPLEEAVSVPRFAETAAETSADPHFARIEFPVSEAVPDDPHGGSASRNPRKRWGKLGTRPAHMVFYWTMKGFPVSGARQRDNKSYPAATSGP